jgi:hypothetical protein
LEREIEFDLQRSTDWETRNIVLAEATRRLIAPLDLIGMEPGGGKWQMPQWDKGQPGQSAAGH